MALPINFLLLFCKYFSDCVNVSLGYKLSRFISLPFSLHTLNMCTQHYNLALLLRLQIDAQLLKFKMQNCFLADTLLNGKVVCHQNCWLGSSAIEYTSQGVLCLPSCGQTTQRFMTVLQQRTYIASERGQAPVQYSKAYWLPQPNEHSIPPHRDGLVPFQSWIILHFQLLWMLQQGSGSE